MHDQSGAKPIAMSQSDGYGDANLLNFLLALAKFKKTIFVFSVSVGVFVLALTFLLPPTYNSVARLMPPQQATGASALLGQLGGIAGVASGVAGLKNPNDLYVGMLQSRTVTDNIIREFKLMDRFQANGMDQARKRLGKVSNISTSKTGLITIETEDMDPGFSANLANAYVDQLIKLTQTLAVGEAAQRRLFFEQQLQAVKSDLADAEQSLRQTQESTGLIKLDGQVQEIIGNVAKIKAAIASKEVELTAMRSFATTANPEYQKLREEIRGLNIQLDKFEKGGARLLGDIAVPSGKVPEVSVQYIRKLRDVKYYETIFELIAKQYELAKIDEAKESSVIQVLDRAVPADLPSKPKRLLIVMSSFMFALFAAVFWVVIFEIVIGGYKVRHPKQYQELKSHLNFFKKTN